MAENSKIEWTDATWNPITGCSIKSPGCRDCYAMQLAGTRLKNHPSRKGLTKDTKAGPVWTGEVRFNEEWIEQPLHWRRPRMIFVCAHGDLFHEGVPDEWIDRVFAVMALAPQHTFQVLTKRSDRMRRYMTDGGAYARVLRAAEPLRARWPKLGSIPISDVRHGAFWPHVWLGVSAERQQEADERIPDLLATPAAVRFVSLEPLIGPIDLRNVRGGTLNALDGIDFEAIGDIRDGGNLSKTQRPAGLDWIIVGGESGPTARPMHPQWARDIRDQCAAAGKLDRLFFKQWGAWRPSGGYIDGQLEHGTHGVSATTGKVAPAGDLMCGNVSGDEWSGYGIIRRVGKKSAGRLLDGELHNGMPA